MHCSIVCGALSTQLCGAVAAKFQRESCVAHLRTLPHGSDSALGGHATLWGIWAHDPSIRILRWGDVTRVNVVVVGLGGVHSCCKAAMHNASEGGQTAVLTAGKQRG